MTGVGIRQVGFAKTAMTAVESEACPTEAMSNADIKTAICKVCASLTSLIYTSVLSGRILTTLIEGDSIVIAQGINGTNTQFAIIELVV